MTGRFLWDDVPNDVTRDPCDEFTVDASVTAKELLEAIDGILDRARAFNELPREWSLC